jgi:hypothetical protein
MTNGVAIPFFSKSNPQDKGCAPVCLKMALHYCGIEWTLDQIHQTCSSFGSKHYTLPWGICLGAASAGVSVVFISKQPRALLPRYEAPIAREAGCTSVQVGRIAAGLIAQCEESEHVELVEWQDSYLELPEKILTSAPDAPTPVIIPTLWWHDIDAHNVVLTALNEREVLYHDPNLQNGADIAMPRQAFYESWTNENTDNDLLLISNEISLLNRWLS